MDLRDSKTQKIAIGFLAFFIVVYVWYSRVYSKYNHAIDAKGLEFETITTNLRNVEMKAKSIDALKIEYSELVNRYQEIEALLPEVKQVPSLLVQLHTASSLTGTKITKVEPQSIESKGFYNVASFNLEMAGTYHDFGKFISYVANFPFIANVSSFDIRSPDDEVVADPFAEDAPMEIGHKKETMIASFVLSSYFVKEEERLQDLVL